MLSGEENAAEPAEDHAGDKYIIHLLFKKLSAACPDHKYATALVNASSAIAFGARGNRKRLEEFIAVLYMGYAPYTTSVLECQCVLGDKASNCTLQLMRAFYCVGGYEYLESALLNSDEDSLEWVMKIAWRYHVCRNTIVKCKGEVIDSQVFSGLGSDIDKSSRSLVSSKKSKKEFKMSSKDLDWDLFAIPILRNRKSISDKAVSTMFEILVGDIRMPKKDKADLYMAPINEFQIIPTLFSKFANLTGSGAKMALENMNVILMNSRTNLEILYRQPHWQNWFIPYLLTSEVDMIVDKKQEGGLAPELESAIFKFAVNLMTMLHYHFFKSKVKGLRNVLRDTRNIIAEKNGWTDEAVAVYRVLLYTLVKRVQNDAVAFQTDYSAPAWDNLLKLFELVEHFIFYDPVDKRNSSATKDGKRRIGLHLYQDGTCQDLIIVLEIIDLLDKKLDLNYLNPSFNSQVAGNQRIVSLGSELFKDKEFFISIRKFFLSLENATGHDAVLKSLSSLLQARKSGKIQTLFSKIGKSSEVEKQLTVAVEEQKVMISNTKVADVQLSQVSEEQILSSAKRGFSSVSAAQRFCIEKRQTALMENPLLLPKQKLKTDSKPKDKDKESEEVKKQSKNSNRDANLDPTNVNVWDLISGVSSSTVAEQGATEDDDTQSVDESTKTDEAFDKDDKISLGPENDQIQEISVKSTRHMKNPTARTVPKIILEDVKAEISHQDESVGSIRPVMTDIPAGSVQQEIIQPESMDIIVESKWAVVNFSFEAEASNELSLKEGQVVEVLQEKESGWWLVTRDNKMGFAPSNYLEVISEETAKRLLQEEISKDESKLSNDAGHVTDHHSPDSSTNHDGAEEKKNEKVNPKYHIPTLLQDEDSGEEDEDIVTDITLNEVRDQIMQVTSENKKEPSPQMKGDFDIQSSKVHIASEEASNFEKVASSSRRLKSPMGLSGSLSSTLRSSSGKILLPDDKKNAPAKVLPSLKDQPSSVEVVNEIESKASEGKEQELKFPEPTQKLRCGYCRCELSPHEFYELEGVICCKDDLLKYFLKCSVCSRHISGEHISLPSGRMHPTCAFCEVCHQVFTSPTDIRHKGGNLYCATHYDDLFGIKCAHCNIVIQGQYLVALGKNWHFHHFFCAGPCNQPLSGEYLVQNDKAYCMEDYKAVVAKKCKKCGDSLLSTGLSVGEFVYHSTCVQCDICGIPHEMGMTFIPETLQSSDTCHRFLCSKDYRAKYLKPCSKCGLTIELNEHRVMGDGRWWHSTCMKCDHCGKSLVGESHFVKDNLILCKEDYEKATCVKCGFCSKPIQAKYVSLLEMKAHTDCVRCSVCDQALFGTNLGIKQSTKTGKLLCSEHFAAENGKKCFECGHYIVKGATLSVKDKTYHAECLTCEICKLNLKGQKFTFVNDKLRCMEHARS